MRSETGADRTSEERYMTRLAALPAAGLTFLAATIILVPATVAGQSYRSVTDARLVSPEPENWLSYRGNYNGWGYSELDQIDAVGGAPVGLTDMLDQNKTSGTESREIVDLLFGVTQVIDRSSLFQINLSLSQAKGYLTDPYKLLSVVDDVSGEPDLYLFENRPDSRFRQSLYGKYRKQLANKDIFTASYRFMTDDWDVDSHTFDFTYRFKINNGYFIQPRLRFYQQSSTYFYRYFLLDSEAVPRFASADYRLGDMETTTIGVKFGKDSNSKHLWSTRLEYYLQSGESSPSEAVGQLTQQDLFPDVDAVLVQFNYSFRW